MLENEIQRGEGAKLVYSRCYAKKEKGRDDPKLVYVKYLDHVLFRNVHISEVKIAEREAVGWLKFQDKEIVFIQTEKSVNVHRDEYEELISGILILRSCINTIFEINLDQVQHKLTSSKRIDRLRKNKSEEH